ncbi:hypothetical protein WK80_22130 [Burkholderia multivorans]|nr:hypothetical protein WK80_22130 [Burkholderia multivorans]
MPFAGLSLPVYMNNVNLSKFRNVNTLGKYGIALCSNNPLSVTPPYASFGTITASDGCLIDGGMHVGYGDHALLYLENANDLQVQQTYHVYAGSAAGKSSYSGDGYSIYINNCIDVDIKIEEDYFPSLFRMEGACSGIRISGITYAGATTVPSTSPIVGFFNGSSIQNSKFDVLPVGSYTANNNYHYTSPGGSSPTLQLFSNVEFVFNSLASPNLAFFNVNATYSVPFWNLRFNGNADIAIGTPLQLLINSVMAGGSAYRYFMNGIRQGTA